MKQSSVYGFCVTIQSYSVCSSWFCCSLKSGTVHSAVHCKIFAIENMRLQKLNEFHAEIEIDKFSIHSHHIRLHRWLAIPHWAHANASIPSAGYNLEENSEKQFRVSLMVDFVESFQAFYCIAFWLCYIMHKNPCKSRKTNQKLSKWMQIHTHWFYAWYFRFNGGDPLFIIISFTNFLLLLLLSLPFMLWLLMPLTLQLFRNKSCLFCVGLGDCLCD